jgi:light-regulated signal transduction histidine kinase (bacteriophytochrome)
MVVEPQDTEHSMAEQRIALLEQRLRARTAELELANRELASFSYSVSHDLRAPLRHVDGFVKLLQEDMAGKLDPSAARHLDTIAAAARRMGMLIDALLSFSRTARLPLHIGPIELRHVVDTVVQELAPESAERQVEWRIGELPEVEGDPVLLRIVLQNLLGNALKFTRTRPLARIEVSAEPDSEGRVVVQVRDNGVGFDMRYAHKLFGVFQRLHREDEFEGTGIGLATAQRIVHRHGGKIWYEAELDRGATFFFTLPAADATLASR